MNEKHEWRKETNERELLKNIKKLIEKWMKGIGWKKEDEVKWKKENE